MLPLTALIDTASDVLEIMTTCSMNIHPRDPVAAATVKMNITQIAHTTEDLEEHRTRDDRRRGTDIETGTTTLATVAFDLQSQTERKADGKRKRKTCLLSMLFLLSRPRVESFLRSN
jgi:hypothetical protein